MVRPWCHAPSCSHLHLLPPGIRQRVAQGLPARGATQLALYPLADLRLLETGESEGGRRSESEGPQPTSQHALAPLRRRRGDYVSGRGQGAAESRPRMHVEQEGTARLPGAIVRFPPFMKCAPRTEKCAIKRVQYGERAQKRKSRGARSFLTLESCVRAYELCVPDTWPDTTVRS